MNSLECIVPPLELCKRIPQGKFADSALVWKCTMFLGVMPPKHVFEVKRRAELFCTTPDAPAPTLQEILEEINNDGHLCPDCCRMWKDWRVQCEDIPVEDGVREVESGAVITTQRDWTNPATAALRLWLEMNKEGKDESRH